MGSVVAFRTGRLAGQRAKRDTRGRSATTLRELVGSVVALRGLLRKSACSVGYLVVNALVSRSISPGLESGREHCVVFFSYF